MVGSWPLDYFGRKPMLIMTQVFMLVACLIEMFATKWTHWLAAKIMNVSPFCSKTLDGELTPQGLSVGCNQMAATTYISEIAPTRVRGAALGLYQLAVSLSLALVCASR
jgi:MFS family permease